MTKLAAEAWEKLQELDDETQNYLARKVLDEIESEREGRAFREEPGCA
ncbi:MAG: hypothetical protein IPI85_05235 [Dehalococcoidia bacterium]|nr:hypothetical protein [Dehalococcoidia bacterium]